MGRLQDALEVDVEDRTVAGSKSAEKEIPKVMVALAATLERLVERNERCLANLGDHRKLTIYHGLRPPNISILKYLERIYKYTNCSPSCFAVGFIYIDRLVHKHPDQPLTSLNVHRLTVTSIMVATKLLDDVHYNNAFYAKVGGISNKELNCLELDFLFQLEFRLQVTSGTFDGYCTYLEREMLCTGQRVERTLPRLGNVPGNDDLPEKENNLEEAQKRILPFVNHNGPSVAAVIARENSGPPSR